MRAIIIEDEPLSVAELRTTLAEVAPQIEVVATASSVAEAAAVIAGVGHDLIFMDIHLGDGSGFDIFQRTEISVPVIFITAYDSYALKAFENKGIDYLLKPFGREDLQRAIDKLGLLSGGGSASAEHGAPTQTPPVYQERFLVHMGARMKSVTTAEIAYFMADGKYLHLVTHDGKDYIVDRTLTEVGEKLPPNLFFRINRLAAQHLQNDKYKPSAVQRRQRQQVHHRQVDRDQGGQVQQAAGRVRSCGRLAPHLRHGIHDPHRARQIPQAHRPPDQLSKAEPHRADIVHRSVPGVMKLVAHCRRVHLPADVDPPALGLVPVLIHPGLVGQVHPIQPEFLPISLYHQVHTVPCTA